MFEITDEICREFIQKIYPEVLHPESVNEPHYMDLIRRHIRYHFILTDIFAQHIAKLNQITHLTLSANNAMI